MTSVWCNGETGVRFTNKFSVGIQIRYKIMDGKIDFLVIISMQGFAQPTAMCHVQNRDHSGYGLGKLEKALAEPIFRE